MAKVSVMGAGSWGLGLAILLNNNGHDVKVWSVFPEEIKAAKKWRSTNLYAYHNKRKTCRGTNQAKYRCYKMEYAKRMRDWQGKEVSRNKPLS